MKKIILLTLLFFTAAFSFAQSADVMTEIINSKEVTYGQVAYLSACHQSILPDNVSYSEAFETLKSINQIKNSAKLDAPVRADDVAAIFSCMWKIKGGLFYRISNASPRYAFKQFKSDGVLPETFDPSQTLTGLQLLNLYTKCMVRYGNMQLDVSE